MSLLVCLGSSCHLTMQNEKEQEVLLQTVICVYWPESLQPFWVGRGGHVVLVCSRTLPGSTAMACGDITGLLTAWLREKKA